MEQWYNSKWNEIRPKKSLDCHPQVNYSGWNPNVVTVSDVVLAQRVVGEVEQLTSTSALRAFCTYNEVLCE